MKIIVVNNPAAKEGGALTILEQFLKKIYSGKRKSLFYIFVSVDNLKKYEKENIKIIVLPKQSFKDRILWDNFGLKNFLKKSGIKPNLAISIQNTGLNLDKNISQILYYHQPLTLIEKKWKLSDKNERKYWLYKNIYPFFIKQHLKKVKKIIVQTNWVKDSFSKKFKYSKNNIFVNKPTINLPSIEEIKKIPKDKFRIFYPAAPLLYKNHKLIVESLGKIVKEKKDLEDKMECIFTFTENDSPIIADYIKQENLESVIKLVGKIPYENVLEYYKSSDLIIFPSYIETLGLPLLEAKHFQLNILTIDLPYSREVIGNYEKVKYFKESSLKMELEKIIQKKEEKNVI